MSAAPYSPTAFAASPINPAVGGQGIAAEIPFISPSEYLAYPTAMETMNLVPGGDEATQNAAFFALLERASIWMDRLTFGISPASKGASLRATLSVESASVPIVRGQLKLICDYTPILEVRGVDVGLNPAQVQSVGATVAAAIRFGRRTVYVPWLWPPSNVPNRSFVEAVPPWEVFAVWAYVNGYPHTSLAEATGTATYDSIEVRPTDGAGGLLGVYPGTRLQIVDGTLSEAFTVASVSGSVITASAPFTFSHTPPDGPDFIPVTALPDDVRLAAIYMTTALLKTRGDEAMLLSEASEPRQRQRTMGDIASDLGIAKRILARYSPRVKR